MTIISNLSFMLSTDLNLLVDRIWAIVFFKALNIAIKEPVNKRSRAVGPRFLESNGAEKQAHDKLFQTRLKPKTLATNFRSNGIFF